MLESRGLSSVLESRGLSSALESHAVEPSTSRSLFIIMILSDRCVNQDHYWVLSLLVGM